MTFKLHTKLQTTIRRIMDEPLCLGRQDVCRPAVLLTAVLMTTVAGAQTQFVRPVAYQQDLNQTGNVPVVRIDSVAQNNDSMVTPVTYASPVSATKSTPNSTVKAEAVDSGNAAKTGKALKWVAVNSPEARAMQERARDNSGYVQDRAVHPTVAKEISQAVSFKKTSKSDSLLTPIPSVMPRYSRVRLTGGEEELALDGIDLDSMDGMDTPAMDGPLAMPAADDLDAEIRPAEDMTDMQIPGAIGNENGESMLEQGGLNQDTDMSDIENGLIPNDGNVEDIQEQLPMMQAPRNNTPSVESSVVPEVKPESSVNSVPEKLPEVEDTPMLPLDSPLLPNETTTETLTQRQVRQEDYDMPCESSEPMHRITEITNDIELHDNKIVPKSCPLAPEGEAFPVREFAGTNFTWTASNLCHNPLYFEQPALERYGHTIGPLQPVLSGAQFLATIPAMPMLMAIDPPNECQYALGYYRPGSCAPRKWSPLPYSTRGAIVEGGVATALVFLIP